jgi:hypothetical protein
MVDEAPKARKYCSDGYVGYLDVDYYVAEYVRNCHDKSDTHNVKSVNAACVLFCHEYFVCACPDKPRHCTPNSRLSRIFQLAVRRQPALEFARETYQTPRQCRQLLMPKTLPTPRPLAPA